MSLSARSKRIVIIAGPNGAARVGRNNQRALRRMMALTSGAMRYAYCIPTSLKMPGQKQLQNTTIEMKKTNSGRLRAIGYDARARMLQVQLDESPPKL